MRLRMIGVIARTHWRFFVRENAGFILAIAFLTCKAIKNQQFSTLGAKDTVHASYKWVMNPVDNFNRFSWDVAFIVFCLPMTPIEVLYFAKNLLQESRRTERLLTIWTVFFFISAAGLYRYIDEVDSKLTQIEAWFIFELHIGLFFAATFALIKKLNGMAGKKLIYGVFTTMGLVWGYSTNSNHLIYPIIFILSAPSFKSSYRWTSKPTIKQTLWAAVDFFFFTYSFQWILMLIFSVHCFFANRV